MGRRRRRTRQLAQTKTADDGGFAFNVDETPASGVSLYLVAKGGVAAVNKGGGDNPALAFLTVLGSTPLAKVVVNEMTTVASVWTNAQFLDGAAIKGPTLSLSIAAGNVPNFVDLQSGGWGATIQDPLNSTQTPTMANLATLADALSGCAARLTVNACDDLFVATTPPKGDAPTDTLTAAEAIARYPWYLPNRLFALVGQLYPVPPGKTMRAVPFMPYLGAAPSAWVLPLKIAGGGYVAGGRRCSTAKVTFGLATISPLVGKAKTRCGKATPANLPLTVDLSHRLPLASLAAGCKAALLGRPSTPTTMPGSPAMAASPSRCSTRTASR
jgi:hypothetical protein